MARNMAMYLCLLPVLFLLGSVQYVAVDVLEVGFHLEEDTPAAFEAQFLLKISELLGVSSADGRYVLPEEPFFQDAQGKKTRLPPVQWIVVELFGAANKRATLYVRGDTLYIMGFANQNGDVYYMGDADGFGEDAEFVGFIENYASLLGDGKVSELFSALSIGRDSAVWAAGILASYDPATSSQVEVKRALAIFVLTISESQRIKVIGDACRANWINGGHIPEEDAKLVQGWRKLSVAFCMREPEALWDRTKMKNLKQIGVSTLAQVDRVLGVVKRPLTDYQWCPKPAAAPVP